jgi:DNA (cytosine-5)-methyltransferase 1
MRGRLLDLFCGGGGGGVGYSRAGFDVVGVDLVERRYPFELVLGDVLEVAA